MTKQEEYNHFIHEPRMMWDWNLGEKIDQGIDIFTYSVAMCGIAFVAFVFWGFSHQTGVSFADVKIW